MLRGMAGRASMGQDIQVLYVSRAVAAFGRDDLERLWAQCDGGNRTSGVTGMLLYSAGNFAQVLEGPPPAIEVIFGRIQRDARHRDVRLLQNLPISTRAFAAWHMGLLDAGSVRPLDRARLVKAMGELAALPPGDEHRRGVALLARFRDLLPPPDLA